MHAETGKMKHLWLFGLRRSGTTAIWQMFRGIDKFTCYDEPFNPKLETHLPKQHRKGTWDEFIHLWNCENSIFLRKIKTISVAAEMLSDCEPEYLEYLSYLAVTPTIIDFTRLNFKLENTLPAFPDAVAVFLYRSPIAFTTSHLINSENNKLFRQKYYRAMFFTRFIGFDSWGLEQNFKSPGLDELIDKCNIIPRKSLKKLQSAEKILLLWLAARRTSQNYVDHDKAGRSFVASYEDIIDGTRSGLDDAIEVLGIDPTKLRRSHFHEYSLGFKHDLPLWRVLARNAGFTEEEIAIYLRHQFQ
jgi:hypothetical protein